MSPGEVREVTELITPGPAEALAGLLGVPGPGEELPLLWHWVYLLDRPPGRAGLVVSGSSDGDAVRVSCRDAADRVTATGVIR